MERSIEEKFLAWKQSSQRKPLILQGARQVGKTYAIKAFGTRHFRTMAYINLVDCQTKCR